MNTHTVHDVCAVFSDTAEEFAEVTEKNNLVQFNATSCRVEMVGPAGGGFRPQHLVCSLCYAVTCFWLRLVWFNVASFPQSSTSDWSEMMPFDLHLPVLNPFIW